MDHEKWVDDHHVDHRVDREERRKDGNHHDQHYHWGEMRDVAT